MPELTLNVKDTWHHYSKFYYSVIRLWHNCLEGGAGGAGGGPAHLGFAVA